MMHDDLSRNHQYHHPKIGRRRKRRRRMTNSPLAAPFKILRRIDHGNEEPCSCSTLLKLPNFINSFFLCENEMTREESWKKVGRKERRKEERRNER